MARRTAALTVFSLSTLAMLAAGGCYADYSEAAAAGIRLNPSPNMDTLYQRPVDIDNNVALVTDTNWRMFNQDLGRVFMFDRPSILAPEPMPHF